MSIALRIRAVLAARVADIRAVGGYATDMGLHVLDSRADPAPADLAIGPAVSVRLGTEEAMERQGGQLRLSREVHVFGWSLAGDDPEATAEALLADIKRAVLRPAEPALTDATGRIGQQLEYARADLLLPDPGEALVTVDVTFTARYFEAYGNPAAAAA